MLYSSIGRRRRINMELYAGIYYTIGIILGLERLSRVTKEDDSSTVCIGVAAIMLLWPLYIIYKVVMCLTHKR